MTQLDEFTRKHLHAWVSEQFPHDENPEAIESMIADFVLASDDVDYWLNHSWWEVYDVALGRKWMQFSIKH